jgi:hypothetical protein
MDGWNNIANAPIDRDVQLWVVDRFGSRALHFPCRMTASGWMNSKMKVVLASGVRPTYWRDWPEDIPR